MLTLTDGLPETMNFNTVFRWHLPFLFLILLTFRAAAADTLLVGISLSAGYRMAASAAWPSLANDKWQNKTSVVNASISGDTSQRDWRVCRRCCNSITALGSGGTWRQRWTTRFAPAQTEQTLRKIIQTVKAADAQPLLMQIHHLTKLRSPL